MIHGSCKLIGHVANMIAELSVVTVFNWRIPFHVNWDPAHIDVVVVDATTSQLNTDLQQQSIDSL